MDKPAILRAYRFVALLLLVSTAANAQWVFVAKKVVGRVSSLTLSPDDKNPGYDAATVILEADAGKVYSTALDLLQKNPKLTITKKDDVKRTLAFRQGDWVAEMKITELGDRVCQLLIASGASPREASGTSAVLDAVKRICGELGVKYTLG